MPFSSGVGTQGQFLLLDLDQSEQLAHVAQTVDQDHWGCFWAHDIEKAVELPAALQARSGGGVVLDQLEEGGPGLRVEVLISAILAERQ